MSKALLKVLNNNEEPLHKRLKIADKAFKASGFRLPHKEALLLKWIINNSTKLSSEEFWSLLSRWLSSKEFKELTPNDITNDDIVSIVELFQNKLLGSNLSVVEKHQIVETILLLCDNKVFQQYCKYATARYCKIIALSLEVIELPLKYIEFITNPCLFPKSIILEEKFCIHFLDLLYPVLVNKVLEFRDNPQVFDETVRIIQKCILQGNIKGFQNFLNNQFESQNGEVEHNVLSKAIFKYLASTLQTDITKATTTFKLFCSAFCESFKDPQWILKLLIFVVEMLQFHIPNSVNIKIPFKHKANIKLSNALEILLGVLSVISNKNVTDCSVGSISFLEFLRNMLKSIMSLKVRNATVYEIILKCISINPLVVETLASYIIAFLMTGAHENIKDIYENVVVAIFDVFAKLHRIEHLIAKIIPALKGAFTTENQLEDKDDTTMVYTFHGERDLEISSETTLCAKDIITENILKCFTRCLNGLASWQIINVFKTLLYHMKNAVEEYARECFDNDSKKLVFLEILGILTTCLLQSVRILDYTIPQNVITKFVNGLDEIMNILRDLGPAVLKRQHNHITMRTFLNLSYVWAEVYLTLTYYSMDDEVKITTVVDKMHSATNLKYLHSYMDIKDWQLLSQRITNFGEYPCKKLLQNLYIQKLRAMMLLEKNLNEDTINNIAKTLQTHLEDTWQDLLKDRFTVNVILPKMDKAPLIFLTEHLMEVDNLYEQNHIKDSVTLTNATVYVVMSNINKLFKVKRKHDAGGQNKNCSSKVFTLCPEEIFFSKGNCDITEVLEQIMELHATWENDTSSSTIASKEQRLLHYLSILRKAPFIYSNLNVQKIVLAYLLALSWDISSCSEEVKTELEDLIIGALQACKFPLNDIFKIEKLGAQVIGNFLRHDVTFSLVVDNVFKLEQSIMDFEPLVLHLIKHLEQPRHLSSSILVLQAVDKVKKSKLDSSTKKQANQYKEKILMKLSKFVCNSNNNMIEAYAVCVKHYLLVGKDTAILQKLLAKLEPYIEYSIDNISEENQRGSALLFTTVLQNKTKIENIPNDIVLKIWNACKKVRIDDEYSHLIKLIVTLFPNDEFEVLVTDLFDITEKSIKDKHYLQLARQLKTWECILTCDVNPTKMKIWHTVLEKLIYELLRILKSTDFDEELYKSIVHLEQSIIQAQHFILSPPLIDKFVMTVSVVMRHEDEHFELLFGLSLSTLEALLKYRHAIIMDRLPSFLQQYRMLLKSITSRSNSDDSSAQKMDVKNASNCVHKLEKLTKNLVACKKDMGRIAVFLIADILERYEQINLYPNVKLHLNNCVYSVMSLCDHHAVSYLMRTLSNASTEMFKIMYQHYKKYYMFTGKV